MRILVLPGDDIGPEITAATMAVPERATDAWDGRAEPREAGGTILAAVDPALADLATPTADLGGSAGTRAFGDAVAAGLG